MAYVYLEIRVFIVKLSQGGSTHQFEAELGLIFNFSAVSHTHLWNMIEC